MARYTASTHWLLVAIGWTALSSSAHADGDARWLFVPVGIGPGGAPSAQLIDSFEHELGGEGGVQPNRAAALRFENSHSSEPVHLSDEQLGKLLEIVGNGRRFLAFGKREEAQGQLQSIEALAAPLRDFLQRTPEHAQVLFNACAMTAQLLLREKQPEAAQQQMTKCVRTWPGFRPGRDAAGTRKLFEAASDALEQEPHGMLTVTGKSSGCSVRVNGIELGKSPVRLRMPIGYVRVQLECERDVPGRIHAVAVGTGDVSIVIDERFDAAVHTAGALWLAYPDEVSRNAHADEDAAVLGKITESSHVALLLVDSLGRRVTLRAGGKDLAVLPFDPDRGYAARDVEEAAGKLRAMIPVARRPEPALVPAHLERVEPVATRGEDDRAGADARLALGIGAISVGVVGIGIGWSMYVHRYSIRAEQRFGNVGYATVDRYQDAAPWLLVSATLGAGALVAASPLLLGEADEIPTAAWVLGGAGVAVGLTGIAFSVFGSHCGPRAGEPCDGIFDDALFGPLVALHALPLLAVPATYALRLWGRAGDLEVRAEGSLVSLRGSF